MKISPVVAAGAAFVGGAGVGAAVSQLMDRETAGRAATQLGVALTGGLATAGALVLGKRMPGAVRAALLGAGGGMVAAAIADAAIGAARKTDAPAPLPLNPGDVLPDGEQLLPEDIYISGNELRFDSFVANTGQAPLQIALRTNKDGKTTSTDQVIYNTDGTRRQVPIRGGLQLDTRSDHNHLHFDDFVYFQLFRTDEQGKSGAQVAAGIKQSFYITDVTEATGTPPKNVAIWKSIEEKLEKRLESVSTGLNATTTQHVSVGRADVYGAGLEGQSLNIEGLKPGVYILRQTFDPNDEIIEMDERNNSRDIRIEITADRNVKVLGSSLTDLSLYERQSDGRTIIPSIVEAMRHTASHGGSEAGHTHT